MLFVERAAAVLPGFELTPGNRTVVIGICERLEGVPLISLSVVRQRVAVVLHRVGARLATTTSRWGNRLVSGRDGAQPVTFPNACSRSRVVQRLAVRPCHVTPGGSPVLGDALVRAHRRGFACCQQVQVDDEVVDHTTTSVLSAVTEEVDLVLNLAPVDPAVLAELVTVVRPGGVVVNTTIWMPAPTGEDRDVRGINLYVRSDAEQLAKLVALVDSGDLRVDVAQRVPLTELPGIHAQAASGAVHGKVVFLVSGV